MTDGYASNNTTWPPPPAHRGVSVNKCPVAEGHARPQSRTARSFTHPPTFVQQDLQVSVRPVLGAVDEIEYDRVELIFRRESQGRIASRSDPDAPASAVPRVRPVAEGHGMLDDVLYRFRRIICVSHRYLREQTLGGTVTLECRQGGRKLRRSP